MPRRCRDLTTVLFAGILLCATVHAANVVWTNTASGNWATAANWNPNQVPSTNDTAWITNNATYTVTLNASATLAGLQLGGTGGTQTSSHATCTLTLNGPGGSSTNGVYALNSGTLDVSYWNGFTPAPGNVFTALVCNARSGGFSVNCSEYSRE